MKIIKISPTTGFPILDTILKVDYTSDVDGYKDWFLVNIAKNSNLWIVFLHGAGSHGDQLYTRQDIREYFIPQYKKYNANILTPNLRDDAWMSPSAVTDLHSILEYISEIYGKDKFIFHGGSMGGTSNLIYAIIHPEDVAGMVVLGAATDLAKFYYVWKKYDTKNAMELAYGGSPETVPLVYEKHSVVKNADRLKMPIYFTHGENDEIIPVEHARELAKRMKNSPNLIYQEIKGGNHDSALWETKALDFVIRKIL